MMVPNFLRWTAPTVALCILASGIQAATPQACRWYVTARAGDTCNSIAAEWGITYAQFIRNNPTITSCYLTAGTKYCVDDVDALLPTTSLGTSVTRPTSSTLAPPTSASGTRSSTATTPTPSVSGFTRDGRCGPQGGSQTCIGSEFGDCCSPEGWCGASDEHCGAGCVFGYGLCGIGPVPSSSATSNATATASGTATNTTTPTSGLAPTAQTTITITAVSSTTLTFFSLVPQTQTTNTTLTQTTLATSTAVITRTQVETTTSTAMSTITRTQVETAILTVAQTSGCAVTVTVTAAGVATPPESISGASGASTTTSTIVPTVTETPTGSSASSAPSPTQPGATSGCK